MDVELACSRDQRSVGFVTDAGDAPGFRCLSEVFKGMRDERFADLLIDKFLVGVQNEAIVALGLVGLRGQVDIVDSGLDRTSFFHLDRRPLTSLFALNELLSVHHK